MNVFPFGDRRWADILRIVCLERICRYLDLVPFNEMSTYHGEEAVDVDELLLSHTLYLSL
nr:hypothetical protein [Halomicroarcula rubra]